MTLKALAKLEQMMEARPQQIEAARAAGQRVVATFCRYLPEELVDAAGLIPIRLVVAGNPEVEDRGSTYLTAGTCSFARSCAGYKEVNTDPYFRNIDYVAEAPSCLQMERVMEVYQDFFNIPILPVALPRKFWTPEALQLFTRELMWLRGELEKITGRPISDEALAASIELYNAIRRGLREIYEYLKGDESPISWEEAFRAVHCAMYLDRNEYAGVLGELVEELRELAKGPGANRVQQSGPRLMIVGSVLATGDTKIIDATRNQNAAIVIDELCTGSRYFWDVTAAPTIAGLAKRYLTSVPCGPLAASTEYGDVRLDHLKQLVSAYRVEGVIYATLRCCDPYTFRVVGTRKALSELGVPMLHIHSDYSDADLGQTQDKIGSFLEVVRSRKLRKQGVALR